MGTPRRIIYHVATVPHGDEINDLHGEEKIPAKGDEIERWGKE
jgi:hypothetical protein